MRASASDSDEMQQLCLHTIFERVYVNAMCRAKWIKWIHRFPIHINLSFLVEGAKMEKNTFCWHFFSNRNSTSVQDSRYKLSKSAMKSVGWHLQRPFPSRTTCKWTIAVRMSTSVIWYCVRTRPQQSGIELVATTIICPLSLLAVVRRTLSAIVFLSDVFFPPRVLQ